MAEDYGDIQKALELSTQQAKSELGAYTPPGPSPVQKYILTPFGKILDVLDTDLNLVTKGLEPVVTALNPQLKEVYAAKGFNVMPSDLIEKSLENDPNRKTLAPILGFAANVAFSPTTYLAGIGTVTKYGKLLEKVHSIAQAGGEIKLESNIAKEIATHYGAEKITPALIGRAVKEAKTFSVASLEQQAKMGQRALINIGVPFTKDAVPLLKSDLFFRGVEKSTEAFKKSKFGEVFNNIFSTSSGNPAFDSFRSKILGGLKYNIEGVKSTSIVPAKLINKISKATGLDRKDVFAMLTDTAENSYRGDISAKALLETFGPNIDKQLVDATNIDKIINDLPGANSIVMDERNKLFNGLMRNAKEKQAGFDVFTPGFNQLPNEVRQVFIKEFFDGLGVKYAKDIKKNGNIVYADFSSIIDAFNRGVKYKGIKLEPGEDAALFALVGKNEFLRLKQAEAGLEATNKALRVPSSLPGQTEGALLRDTTHRIRAAADQGFSTAYTLFRNSPDYLKSISPRMFKLIKLIDSKNEWKVTSLVDQFRVPLQLAEKHPYLFDMAQEHRKWFQDQLQRELDAGVGTPEWTGGFNYIIHTPTKEAREILGKKYGEFSGGARQWNVEHQSMLQRKLRNINTRGVEEFFNTGEITKGQRKSLLGPNGMEYSEQLQKAKKWSDAKTAKLYSYLTVSQANALGKTGDLKVLGGIKVDKFFEDNPASQILIRGVRGEKAIAAVDFYEGARQFGRWHPIDQPLPPGIEFVKNEAANPLAKIRTKTTLVGGKPVTQTFKLAFDKGVAKHIDELHRSLVVPPELHPLLKVYDGLQSEWKAWTLGIFPAYHVRNIVGNLWNNYLGGIHTPDPYLKALKIQLGKDIKILHGAGQELSGAEVLLQAKKQGILNVGQYFGDIREFYEQDINAARNFYTKYGRYPVSAGLKVGNYLENNAKLAMFVRRIEEGFSFQDAAMEAKKYLFDYSDLTTVERDVLRRGFPFYSWTRKNIPLQLEALLTHPSRLMTVAKAKNVLESNYDGVPDERLLPDYYAQNFPIRVRYDKGTNQFQYLLLNNWLPAADIDKIFDPPTWVKNQLTPLLKEPMQQLANRDFFTNKEIDKGDEYQTIKILGMNLNLPARQAHVIKNIRFINELDRLSTPEVPTSEKIGRSLFGRVNVSLDEDKQRQLVRSEYRDKRNRLRSALKKARFAGNDSEVNRIEKEIGKLTEERNAKL